MPRSENRGIGTIVALAVALLSIPTVPGAASAAELTAADFRKVDKRIEARDRMIAKDWHEEQRCGSFSAAKSEYFARCGADMFPIYRQACFKEFNRIMTMKICEQRTVAMKGATVGDKCITLKQVQAQDCGAGMAPDLREDCADGAAYIAENCR